MNWSNTRVIYLQKRGGCICQHTHQPALDDFDLAEYVMAAGQNLGWDEAVSDRRDHYIPLRSDLTLGLRPVQASWQLLTAWFGFTPCSGAEQHI